MRRAPLLVVCALVSAALAAACSRGSEGEGADVAAADTLTRRQRDSVIADSKLPGAGAVGRAREAADRASARARMEDSLAASPR